ncbi:DNA-binding transcriptional LysR family regulator [Leifsonia sp. EB41]
MSLTPAGELLLHEACLILGAVDAASRRTRSAGRAHREVVFAIKAGASTSLVARILDAYAEQPGAVPVSLLTCEAQEQRHALLSGAADVALLHLPFDSMEDLEYDMLATETQVALVQTSSRIAGAPSVRVADVLGLGEAPLARWPDSAGNYPNGPGPEVRNLTQIAELIALGRATAMVPRSAAHALPEGCVAIPVFDAPAVTTVIAWPWFSRSRPAADLIRAAGGVAGESGDE